MQGSLTKNESAWNDRSVVIWGILLCVLTLGGALPLIIGGLNFYDLPETAPLLPLALTGIIFIAYTPSLAALLVAGFLPWAGGVRALLKQMGTWRVGVAWYLLALLGPIALVLLADVIYILFGGAPPRQWLIIPSDLAFLGPLLAGSLGEELGWRGFALPRLQNRYGALWASIIIGTIWSTWHVWPLITPGGLAHFSLPDLAQTFIRLIATAILYTWLYNSTNGSLFLVMIAHAGHNIAIDLIQIPQQRTEAVPIIIALLYLAAAIAVTLITRPRTLSRSNSDT